jgi:Uma2 family endonuclease
MSTLPTRRLSPEEYLELERKAEFKSEYYNGEMFAMSGASRHHISVERPHLAAPKESALRAVHR